MKAKNIIYLVFGFLAYYLLKLFQAKDLITFQVGGVSNVSLKGGYLSWIQTIRAKNLSNTSVYIRAVNVNNTINGATLGTSTLSEPTTINVGDTDLKLLVQIPYFDLINLIGGIQNVINTKKISVNFKGTLHPFLLNLDLDVTQTINIPKF